MQKVQAVSIKIDTFANKIFKGTVDSIQKAPLWLMSLIVTMPTFFAFLATSATNVAP